MLARSMWLSSKSASDRRGTPFATASFTMSVMSGSDATKRASDLKLTYDDFLLFPDDGKRHELIDGEHYVTASPNTKHQRVSGNLHWLLRTYLEQHAIGKVYYAP